MSLPHPHPVSRAVHRGVACLALLCVAWLPAAASAQAPAATPASIGTAIDAVRPALVRLAVVFSEFEGGREVRREASGSGFIITPEGHVLTNHHVAGRATRVQVTMPDGRELDADVVAADAMSDLAVVKLRARPGTAFPTVRFGESSKLALGEPVLAMGSPLGLSQSVTAGVVSNLALVMPRRLEIEGEDVGALVRWIGHDAPIFPGNSGGPLVNLRGEVVGVNEIGFGLGGAIPGTLAREVADALIRSGRVRRAWIGLELQPLLGGTDADEGALVGACVAGSPADLAGVHPGDVLLRLDDAPVLARTAEDVAPLNLRMAGLAIGSPVDIIVLRDGQSMTLRVTPVEREARRAPVEEVAVLGFAGANLTSWHARDLRRPSPSGVLVHSVRPGGNLDAARPRLQAGDVIVAVDGTDIATLAELRSTLGSSQDSGRSPGPLLLTFERGHSRFQTLVDGSAREFSDNSTEAARAWLPVDTQPLTPDLAARLGMPGTKGALVTRVYPGSAAERAGLRPGDAILDFDGEAVATTRGDDADPLPAIVRRRRIGTAVPVTVWRGGQQETVEVTLEASPPSARDAERRRDEWLGFSARELVLQDDEPAGGVKVEEVVEGGWAALARLGVGDVILSIDGTNTPDIEAFERAMELTASARPERVVLLVRRGPSTRFIEMRPTWPPATP